MTFRDGADLFTDRSFRICGSVWGRQACRPFSTRAHSWRLSPQRALTRGGAPPDARSLAAALPNARSLVARRRRRTRSSVQWLRVNLLARTMTSSLNTSTGGPIAGRRGGKEPREPDPRNCAEGDALRRGGADGTGNAGTQAGSGGPVPASCALRSPQGADPAMTQQPWTFGDPAHNGGLPRFDPVSMQHLRDSDIRPSRCPP